MKHGFAPAGMTTEKAEVIVSHLQSRLADLIDLSLTLKHVHWNVVGFGFRSAHEMMDEQADTVRGLIDEMAERITTMGAIAAGLPGQVIDSRSSDADYSLGRGPVTAHFGALDKVYERVIGHFRESIPAVEDDHVSQDLLISQTATLDLNHWFIRAHLSDTEGDLATEGTQDELEAAATSASLMQPGGETERAEDDQRTREDDEGERDEEKDKELAPLT